MKCGCAVGVNEMYLPMTICVIYWLILSICVCGEVISTSLDHVWFLSWELELVRSDIYMLYAFFSVTKFEAAMFILDASPSTVVNIADFFECKSIFVIVSHKPFVKKYEPAQNCLK